MMQTCKRLTILLACLLVGPAAAEEPTDPVLAGDPIDPASGAAALIVPGAPWIQPGLDGSFGTPDDVAVPGVQGDVDLVLRIGDRPAGTIGEPLSLSADPPGLAMPFSKGFPVEFTVYFSDGDGVEPWGDAVEPSYMDGLPFLVMAFADLDGDGYVGITHLDGNPLDSDLERYELEPVSRRYALGRHGTAKGHLAIPVGGPPEQRVSVALAAAALAGPFDDPDLHCAGCHAWEGSEAWQVLPMSTDLRAVDPYPNGPVVTTKLPFVPEVTPDVLFPPGIDRMSAHADGRVGAQFQARLEPDPSAAHTGEAFTILLDGSEPTLDIAHVKSVIPTTVGLARPADASTYQPGPDSWLRPARDGAGEPLAWEIRSLGVIPSGAGETLRLVGLDPLGNLTLPWPLPVEVTASSGFEIVSPDSDADPSRETLTLPDWLGLEITLRSTAAPGSQGTLTVDSNPLLAVIGLVAAP